MIIHPCFCVHFQHMEDLWRDARWMVILQSARYKHQSSGVSLSWIIDFSKESIPEKPASSSSQVDYLPSPTTSPETTRKHNGESVHLSVLTGHFIIKSSRVHITELDCGKLHVTWPLNTEETLFGVAAISI